MIKRLLSALLLSTCLISPARAEFTAEQTAEIQTIMKDYLVSHPDVLREALEALQTKMQAEAAAQQAEEDKKQVELLADKNIIARLQDHKIVPVDGNAEGDVTVVEFFDYNCGYCRKSYGALQQLLQNDSKVRVIYREFPVLGPESVVAAKAALASAAQGKYIDFHNALMQSPGQLNDETVLAIAKGSGLDIARLEKDMNSEAVIGEIEKNHALAQELYIKGTPAFIIGNHMFPGDVSFEALKSQVDSERTQKPE